MADIDVAAAAMRESYTVGEAEDHQLAWYAAQELPFLLELL
ncbi:DUF6912 family protein [Nocardia sp. 004]